MDIVEEIRDKLSSEANRLFMNKALRILDRHDIHVDVNEAEKESDYSGSFSSTEKTLEIFLGDDPLENFKTFVHEYCHFEQWKYKFKLWHEGSCIDECLHPENYGKDITWNLKQAQALERDCERRVIRKIKSGRIELDIKKYYKEANCYIAFYDILGLSRKWNVRGHPYYRKLLDMMPDNRLITSIDSLGKEKHEYVIECIKICY